MGYNELEFYSADFISVTLKETNSDKWTIRSSENHPFSSVRNFLLNIFGV